MKKLELSDLKSNEEYLKIRDERRKESTALKKKRRVDAPHTSFVTIGGERAFAEFKTKV